MKFVHWVKEFNSVNTMKNIFITFEAAATAMGLKIIGGDTKYMTTKNNKQIVDNTCIQINRYLSI